MNTTSCIYIQTEQEREAVGFALADTVVAYIKKAMALPSSDPNKARLIIQCSVLNDVLERLTMVRVENITLTEENIHEHAA